MRRWKSQGYAASRSDWDRDRHDRPPLAVHCYKLVVHCEVVDIGTFNANSETLAAGFFAIDARMSVSSLALEVAVDDIYAGIELTDP